jgi:glucosamine--fructose-6-phosphate aminotransferase (isomerizing)
MTYQPGEYTIREIRTQSQSWQSALDATHSRKKPLLDLFARNAQARVFFIGCGSTHYLAQFAAPFFQESTGRVCSGVASSELLLQTDSLVSSDERPLIVCLSRSGDTTETILAASRMKKRGCEVVVVSCYDQTPLSQLADLTICLPEGREESFAQTRSFTGMLVAIQVMAALVADDQALLQELTRLPELGPATIERADALAQRYGPDESLRRVTFLGAGALYGLASEATVKAKEMSHSSAEPYQFMEFRHGPMALVDSEHLVVALLTDRLRAYELSVLSDLKQKGAHIVGMAESSDELASGLDALFPLKSGLSEAARAVLYLPFLQLYAYHRAIGRGLNPDRPRNVVMAIQLDGPDMR